VNPALLVPVFPVREIDLVQKGLSGPAVGERLRALQLLWIESDYRLSREQLLGLLPPEWETSNEPN
jgi:hypothetical protein